MQNTDYAEFARMWNFYRSTFNHQPLATEAMAMIFDVLSDLTLDQIVQGMRLALQSCKSMPSVADVREQVAKLSGQDKTQLKHEAEVAFQALNKTASRNGSVYDWVIEDPKLCAVVIRMWGSPQRFTVLSSDNPRDYTIMQNCFIKAWLETTEAELMDPALPHVFVGSYPDRNKPCVLFCGDYRKCVELGEQYYTNLGAKPNYPQQPSTHAVLVLPDDTPDVTTPEGRTKGLANLDHVMDSLRGLGMFL